MATEAENLALVRRFFEDVWGGKKLDRTEGYFADEYTFHHPHHSSVKTGHEAQKELSSMYLNAFPDHAALIDDIFAAGDKVVIRWSAHGTHRGRPYLGFAPSHKSAKLQGITIFQVADGKIVRSWMAMDTYGMLQQLGHLPKSGA